MFFKQLFSCGKAKRTKNVNEFTCVTGAVSVPGKDLAATVTVAKGDDVTDNVVDVLPPQIIELTPTEGPTYGESVITIEGVGFGTNNDIVEAYVGEEKCTKTTLVSNTRVECISPKSVTIAGPVIVNIVVASVSSVAMAGSGKEGKESIT